MPLITKRDEEKNKFDEEVNAIASVAQTQSKDFPPFVNTTKEIEAKSEKTTQNVGPFEPMPVFKNNIPT